MSYFKYNVSLTQGQREKMLRSFQKKAPFTIRLKNSQLIGSDPLMLTQTQIKRIEKSRRNGTGTDLRISAAQMRKQDGGSLFSAILPMMSKVGAMALPWLSKAAAPLATGALSGFHLLGLISCSEVVFFPYRRTRLINWFNIRIILLHHRRNRSFQHYKVGLVFLDSD